MMVSLLSGYCLLLASGLPSDEALENRLAQAVRDQNACGPRAVWYCLRRLGRDVQLDAIQAESNQQADGTSLADLVRLLRHYDVPVEAIRGDLRNLRDLPVPAIIIIQKKHCVVYEGMDPDSNMVRFYEPTQGRHRRASLEAFQRQGSGEVILCQPLPPSTGALLASGALGLFGSIGGTLLGVWLSKKAFSRWEGPRGAVGQGVGGVVGVEQAPSLER